MTVTAATNTKTYDGTTSVGDADGDHGRQSGKADTGGFSETYDTKNVGTGRR